ncbi:DKK3 protein, partial [Atractosteus spatula]|nr:DKK3 protein [Atractosteus spatula]
MRIRGACLADTSGSRSRMMQFAAFILCVALINGSALSTTFNSDITPALQAGLAQGHASLNDMFREVEELMEDTQHKLEEAVYQVDNETAKSLINMDDLPLNYHDESKTEKKVGNTSVHTFQKIDKVTDNKTGATFFSKTVIKSSSKENQIDRECIINEDCGSGKYCSYELLQSKCLPCKTQDSKCTKDEECCNDQLCVLGQCSNSVAKGEAGSICQYQTDCSAGLCCAFHKTLLFPICTPKPGEGERCHSHANSLLDLLSWDIEAEGPRETCPCIGALRCQPHGRGSLCERRRNSSNEER